MIRWRCERHGRGTVLAALILAAGPARSAGWEPVALVTAAARSAGHAGGEGAQWPRALAADSIDGRFVLFGTDVGGLFRSRDGGAHWEPCNVGYTPRGTAGLAIDPGNPDRVLSVGANSVATDAHGLWLSTDGAASWRQVQKANIGGSNDRRTQLAFDPATWNPAAKRTTVIYWSRIADDRPHWGTPEIRPALWRSDDGGEVWRELPGTVAQGGSRIAVHPTRGTLYAGNAGGLFRSTDGGTSFRKTFTGTVTGVAVSRATPDRVWITTPGALLVSMDSGRSFKPVRGSSAIAASGARLENAGVSPVDPRRIVVWREAANWQWKRFASADGGATWTEARFDNTHAFLPYNVRQGLFAWHPADAATCWAVGGDWPTKSTDGGRIWKWSGDGDNGVLVGGAWNFSQSDPDVLAFGSQDYNGAVTLDGGATWRLTNISGHGWGGFCYGGYAATRHVLVAGNAAGWGEPRELKVSFDGGLTWTGTGKVFGGPDASFGDPADSKVIFASNWRSADGGRSWQKMDGCRAVYAADRTTGILYGVGTRSPSGAVIVSSRDHGSGWQRVAELEKDITDLAVEPGGARVWAVADGRLRVHERGGWRDPGAMPADQWGGVRVRSVALDPADPLIVYAACNRDVISTSVSVVRSTDGGKTWTNLTRQSPLDGTGRDGGREAIWVRVHPRTRAVWVSTSCYGIWKHPAP